MAQDFLFRISFKFDYLVKPCLCKAFLLIGFAFVLQDHVWSLVYFFKWRLVYENV